MSRHGNQTAPSDVRRLDLRRVRQKKGISLEEIAESTKISIRFLRAIEDEEFEKLPGGIFNTSYLRQYAAAIGFEEARLLAYYNRRLPAMPETESPSRMRWFRTTAAG